jgi:TPR repeat protein
MGSTLTTMIERKWASLRPMRAYLIAAVAALALSVSASFAEAASLRQGVSAFTRENYPAAARIFIPLAERGDASAQSYLGFMFEAGRGVPQN